MAGCLLDAKRCYLMGRTRELKKQRGFFLHGHLCRKPGIQKTKGFGKLAASLSEHSTFATSSFLTGSAGWQAEPCSLTC